MKRAWTAVVAATVAALCACGEVVSLSPLESPETRVADAGLTGKWRQVPKPDEEPDGQPEVFTLVEHEGGYEFRGEGGEAGPGVGIRMALVEIGGARYIDMTFVAGSDKKTSEALGTGLTTHRLSKYTREGDRFTMRGLDFAAFKRLVERGDPGIAFVRMEGGAVVDRFGPEREGSPFQQVVLTATTGRLQEWIAAHADDPALWGEATVFERVKADAPAKP